MNNERRKALGKLFDELARLAAEAGELKDQIENLKDEEQDYFDAMPESFQNGDKGDKANEAIEALDNLIGEIEGFADIDLDDARNAIE